MSRKVVSLLELTEDVLVSHQDRLIDLSLTEPAGLLAGEEDFDGHLLASPAAQPHLAIATFPNLTNHLDLLGDGPLHLKDTNMTSSLLWKSQNLKMITNLYPSHKLVLSKTSYLSLKCLLFSC